MKDELTIGVLGGTGTYATINVFKQYAEIFEVEKEWINKSNDRFITRIKVSRL